MRKLIFLLVALVAISMSLPGCKSAAERRQEFLRDSLQRDSVVKDSLRQDSIRKDSIRWTFSSIDLDAHALKGPIDECNYEIKPEDGINQIITLKFDSKGNLEDDIAVIGLDRAFNIGHDESGLIANAQIRYNHNCDIAMDPEHRIVNVSEGTLSMDLKYDSNNKYPQEIGDHFDTEGSITTIKFKYDKFDSHGNWVHCNYIETLLTPYNTPPCVIKGTITRTITPFPFSKKVMK